LDGILSDCLAQRVVADVLDVLEPDPGCVLIVQEWQKCEPTPARYRRGFMQ
jgi:hypothetical protein